MSFVYFNSSAKEYFPLSNFNHAPVTINREKLDKSWIELNPQLESFFEEGEEMSFPSIEHLWHALKATDRDTFVEFSSNGRFGEHDVKAFALVFSETEAGQKKAWWMNKRNVGIIPKMASSEKRGFKLNINRKMRYERERPEPRLEKRIWLALLEHKYRQNHKHRDLLKKTRGKKLIEFARGAAREGAKEHWGGCFVDGKLHGDNVMGQYMEEVRDKLIEEDQDQE